MSASDIGNANNNRVEQEIDMNSSNNNNISWNEFLRGSNNNMNLGNINVNNINRRIESITALSSIIKLQSDIIVKELTDSQLELRKRKSDQLLYQSSKKRNDGAGNEVSDKNVRKCQYKNCNKFSQGATKFCIAHGGGRRCTFPGCFKGARDKFFCAAHGGGKRCTANDCTKSAVGGSNLCTSHGGGRRCQFEGCNKSTQSSTNYCVKHGGGRSCIYDGCSKVARSKSDYCKAHGDKV